MADAGALTDGDKLRVLAAWFDMWDRPDTDRRAILDDERNPGKNDVQRDLRRIADLLDAASPDDGSGSQVCHHDGIEDASDCPRAGS